MKRNGWIQNEKGNYVRTAPDGNRIVVFYNHDRSGWQWVYEKEFSEIMDEDEALAEAETFMRELLARILD